MLQSLLKERRRPPTGGLIESKEEGFHTLVPLGEVMTTSGASVIRFSPLPEENDWLLLGWIPVGDSFLIVVGTTKGLALILSKTLSIFRDAFLGETLLCASQVVI